MGLTIRITLWHYKAQNSYLHATTKWSDWEDEQNIAGKGEVFVNWCIIAQEVLRKRKDLYTACYCINKCPFTTLNFKTTEEVWFGKLANYEALRVFRCVEYVHKKMGKLELRAMKCIFMSYLESVEEV